MKVLASRRVGIQAGRVCPSTGFFLTLVLATFFAACGQKEKTLPPPPPADVSVIDLSMMKVPIFRDFVATTYAKDQVDVRARVDGFIEKREFEAGQSVKAGAVLYVLDQRPYIAAVKKAEADVAEARAGLTFAQQQVEVLEAQAQMAEAKAALMKAQQDYARTEPLVAKNVAPKQDLDAARASRDAAQAAYEARQANLAQKQLTTKAKIESAQAQLDSALAMLDQAKLDLEYSTITAPVSGLIGDSLVSVGGLVTKNSGQPLTRIAPLNPISAKFKMSESDYLEARKSSVDTSSSIELFLVLANDTTHPYQGQIVRSQNEVDPQTGTLELQADFPNPGGVILPGQFGRVRAHIEDRQALLVPQRSIIETQGMQSVLTVDSQNVVQMRSVVVGERIGNLRIIDEGLKPGDRVIVEGLQKARAGATVNPMTVKIPIVVDELTKHFAGQTTGSATSHAPAAEETSASGEVLTPAERI